MEILIRTEGILCLDFGLSRRSGELIQKGLAIARR
jgi:hypothetical protein